MAGVLNLLVLDDDEGDRRNIRHALTDSGLRFTLTETATVAEATRAFEADEFDCGLVDYHLPGTDGLSGIVDFHRRCPYMALIMCTGKGDEAVAVEAMKRGATDYIQKRQIDAEALRHVIENALTKVAMQRKLDSQRLELEMFAKVLAHDIRAPMGAIQSLAQIVATDIRGGRLDEAVARSQILVRAANRSGALVEALSEFTKTDPAIAFGPTDMELVLRDTLLLLGELIDQRGAKVTHDPLPAVTGHAALLVQLLQNLIGNGIKYCVASVPAVHVAATPCDRGWLFSLQDNGIGIPEKHYAAVFEAFHRLHSQDKYEGSGLGLATCKKIVGRHGGRIWCDSTEGQGTTFYFTLPAVGEAVPASPARPA